MEMATGEGFQGSDSVGGGSKGGSVVSVNRERERALREGVDNVESANHSRGCWQEETRGPFRGHGGQNRNKSQGTVARRLGVLMGPVDRLLRPTPRPAVLRGRRTMGQGLCFPTLSFLVWGLGGQLPRMAALAALSQAHLCMAAWGKGWLGEWGVGGEGEVSNAQLALNSPQSFPKGRAEAFELVCLDSWPDYLSRFIRMRV